MKNWLNFCVTHWIRIACHTCLTGGKWKELSRCDLLLLTRMLSYAPPPPVYPRQLEALVIHAIAAHNSALVSLCLSRWSEIEEVRVERGEREKEREREREMR